MDFELKILGPVLLVLLAGYLASTPTTLDESSSLLTGAFVTETAKCPADKVILKLSGMNNAHAALFNFNHEKYTHVLCAEDPISSTERTCSPNDANMIVRLSGKDNAHVQTKLETGYTVPVCYGRLSCTYAEKCTDIRAQCLGSLSGKTNAHVGRCVDYPIKICCKEGSPIIKDTDKDGVYDDVGTKPCNPKVHHDLKTCQDNCQKTPNGPLIGTCIGGGNNGKVCDPKQAEKADILLCPGGVCEAGQKDTDGDGAGDVCDKFPGDACSIEKTGDNCRNYDKCTKSLKAKWTTLPSIVEGNNAGLEVTGDASCANLTFAFNVIDSDNKPAQRDPQIARFSGGKAKTTWEAEYHSGRSNKYSFQAMSSQNIQISSGSSAPLTVTPDTSSGEECGDGKTQRSKGEECDEGSNNCQYNKTEVSSTRNCGTKYKCYKDCKLIPGKDGGSCKTDPKCKGKPTGLFAICDRSKLNTVQYCIKGVGGCLKLSTTQQCEKIGSVKKVCQPGAPSCISPTCSAQYPIGSCTNKQQKQTCTSTGGAHCNTLCTRYPKTLACFEEPKEDFPFFSGFNILVTLLLLVTFYGFKRNVRWNLR
tara:strand:+ start:7386 stop:9152 length:1767 start_codon:yes stop_codon:yes gene_type:complete